ncbi:cytochrome P450 [Coniophora puteana RWD-64-598 SS2]|uniref:Cytochrome P450 n=1 Tax=Coniophora puteana (strain RWD-64-598) TaxID=741705 RepID=A0A5M3MJY4_CONPW|nr:cytochrome P450 [Coniophora puteana RWD-64-598 SS2]EIW79538.1 cytochrome P450 [Coniophora puteana RWD-64-598 SS2]
MMDTLKNAYSSIPFAWLCLAVSSVTLVYYLVSELRPPCPVEDDFPTKRRDLFLGSFDFFRDSFKFLLSCREWAQGAHMGFYILSHRVVMVRGLPGRDVFFSKGLDFMAGYRLLNPQLVDVMPVTEIKGDESWASFMATFIRSEVLDKLTPTMVQDMANIVDAWGDKGTVDPFDGVYEIIFALSMRLATCNEFCSDREKVRTMMRIFQRLEDGSTPASIILSWVPTPSRMRRLWAGGELYKMISDVVSARKRENRREDDPLQALIDKGFNLVEITRFIAMTLFAAVTNTGNVFCWFLIYLELHKKWKSSILSEIDAFVETHSSVSRSTSPFSTSTIAEALSRAGPDALEAATPTLDATLHETIRIVFNGFFMRRNIGSALSLDGRRIPHGAFLMFPTADLHFDPALFPDPHAFEPARFTPAAMEARRAEHGIAFLGWGAARHQCVGKRAALVMMKMITVMLLARFDMGVVDGRGRTLVEVPKPRQDTLFKVSPTLTRTLLTYEVRRDA